MNYVNVGYCGFLFRNAAAINDDPGPFCSFVVGYGTSSTQLIKINKAEEMNYVGVDAMDSSLKAAETP